LNENVRFSVIQNTHSVFETVIWRVKQHPTIS